MIRQLERTHGDMNMFEGSYSVSEITAHIKDRLDSDPTLQDLWVRGEISNWSRPRSGHCYFTIKDAGAAIRAVMWRFAADRLSFLPQDGQAVLAHGKVSVYAPQGSYQLYVDTLQPAGRGALYAQFEAVKERLAAEGLFETSRKRPLVSFPARVGVVTSATGAALRDILHVLERRWPVVQVVLAPTLVQGEQAPSQIVAALQLLYRREDLDLIIVARGGGSIEDLWAFNDEQVARTIARSPVPTISGVGHETDVTISDFVADVRAPTPSAAAEVAVPDQTQVRVSLNGIQKTMTESVLGSLHKKGQQLGSLQQQLEKLSPELRIVRYRQHVDELVAQLERLGERRIQAWRERLAGLVGRLGGLDPHATLARGYAIVHKHGRVVQSTDQLAVGDELDVRVARGEFRAGVTSVEESG